MIRLSVPYAIICGVFLVILFALSFHFGLNPLMDLSQLLFDVIVFGVFGFFLIKDFKQRTENNLHFWQGMSLSFLLSVLATSLFLVILGVYQLVDDGLVANYQEAATAFLMEKKDLYVSQFGEQAFEQQLTSIQDVTLADLMLSVGVKKLIAGLFLGPVITIILRTKPK